MTWTIIAILAVLWLLGIVANIGGQFVHLLIIAAGAVLIFNLISNRRSAF